MALTGSGENINKQLQAENELISEKANWRTNNSHPTRNFLKNSSS